MEPSLTTIDVRHFTHDDAAEIRQTLLDVHADAYADRADDPFVQRFPWFVDHWSSHPGFSCVIGYDGSEPVGYAYGAAANPDREWWREHLTPAPAKTRTFHVSELMVRPKWRKHGHSERLHRALLGVRDDDLAALLVDVTHPKVQALYESWGYRKVGERQPFPDSPVYAVMLADLPLHLIR
ncbi:GNAT family N-acetyltransferase [Streptomyces triculaminicus]|uniref:GNAT family N-acetyltransferase n=2 Tax=Streptomyces TaxID=1883 RepID=A0A939FMB2_9ACTN|nr:MULTISPECIES: GNAT family N-acetyltransferase [Streptomyces]MBO0654188.1 GNAT family N-acetyltransferase [Streptomyces triculaminicus]QSY48862.1 GNAT family N-acetyltransferase [Streptomyces griseocarneus]